MAEKRPTILQIIPELDTGGAERTTVEVAEAIVRAGGRCIVLADGGRLCAEVEDAGARMIQFPAATKNPIRMLQNAAAIARIIRNEHVDLVHARSRAPAWSAFMAARRTKAHFVTTYHGIYREKGRFKRLYNSVMARGEIVIANSAYTAVLVSERYGINPGRIVVVNRGVDIARFDRGKIDAERINALRTSWGISPEQRIVLHPARLTSWKGQGTVVDAAARLAQQTAFDDVVFILAGDAQGRDDYVGHLRLKIDKHGLGQRVRLVGHVVDMPAALAASDVMVIASTEPEAFGRTSVEAQALGVPVVATNIGAPPSTVLAPPHHAAAAATGRLVPPGDCVRLADAVAELLTLPAMKRQQLGERARANARDNFTTRALQLGTLGVYDKLLGTDLAARFAAVTSGNLTSRS